MRIFKHRNLLGCLFAVILAMPLIQIGVRCAYTIFNKNAKDSYSGDTTYEINYKYQSNEVNNINDLQYNNVYLLGSFDITKWEDSQLDVRMNFDIVHGQLHYTLNSVEDNYVDESIIYTETNINIYIGYNSITLETYNSVDTTISIDSFNGVDCTIKLYNFEDWSTDDIGITNILSKSNYNEIVSVDIDTSGTLDNAFDYSISKITESNNIGELKFFTWFADIFLDLDNSSNALYINFINWYFNYALLVSAVYILFLALMWFIMWVRKLLERGMDFGNRSW